jgi:hypothetical protein
VHIIFWSSTYGDTDLEHAASSNQSSTRTLRRRTVRLIAELVEADRLHASTACKAHPVGYRDIPRGPSSFTWRRPLLQPTTTEQPAPEQPAPEQPAPEQPAPEQPAPFQHAAVWQTWVQIPPYLQRCADGATTFSSTQHLLSGDVTPPEDQRSPSAD